MAWIDLKALRLQEGLNKSAMISLFHIEKAKYDAYEAGEAELPLNLYLEICRTFSLQPEAFLQQDRNILHDETLSGFLASGKRLPWESEDETDPVPEKDLPIGEEEAKAILKLKRLFIIGKGPEANAMLDKLLGEDA